MQFRNNRQQAPFATFAALPFAVLIMLLPGGPAKASGCNSTNDLPCELSIPTGTFWWNYFNSVGNALNVDSECGMKPPVDTEAALEGETWIGLDIEPTPHRLSYEMFVKPDPAFETMPGKIVILDMVREDRGDLVPVLELRLTAKTNVVKLVVQSDDGMIVIGSGEIDPEGSVVTVELTKSLGSDTGDASARLRIDDRPWKESSCFHLWENLPSGIRMGVVAVESAEPRGNLEFQPIGFRHQFFGNTR